MTEAVIVSAVRTPVGAFNGALASVSATELGAHAIRAALERAHLTAADDVVMGNVLQAGLGQNPARQAALQAGLPDTVPAQTINRVCGSGLSAVIMAAQAVRLGDAQTVVAGGMENMSRAPYLLEKARFGYRMGNAELVDSMIRDGLWCALEDCHMGITAENVAREMEVTRQAQDEFAATSQQRAQRAIEAGVFAAEIAPLTVTRGREQVTVDTDEHPRFGTTAATLAKLRAAFQPEGSVTAGNASGLNDGAAAVVVMGDLAAATAGRTPLARIRSYAVAGVPPRIMGIGPVPAIRRALERAELTVSDIDLFELNEAFAAQSIAVMRELALPEDRVNVNGGAIALGHPIGASGTRILVTLLYEMERRDAHRGLAALCVGGGQGVAMVVERG